MPTPSLTPSRVRSQPPANNSPASKTSPTTTTSTNLASTRAILLRTQAYSPRVPGASKSWPRETAQGVRHRRRAQTPPARRARLSSSLCRSMEHGHPLGRLLALRIHQGLRSAQQSQVRPVPLLLQPQGGEVGIRVHHLLALLRGPADR